MLSITNHESDPRAPLCSSVQMGLTILGDRPKVQQFLASSMTVKHGSVNIPTLSSWIINIFKMYEDISFDHLRINQEDTTIPLQSRKPLRKAMKNLWFFPSICPTKTWAAGRSVAELRVGSGVFHPARLVRHGMITRDDADGSYHKHAARAIG